MRADSGFLCTLILLLACGDHSLAQDLTVKVIDESTNVAVGNAVV